jgi:hypothetical protein
MAPDYDLSNLPTSQADLWIYLQVDAIVGQILSDQAERWGFPLALGACIVAALTGKSQAILNGGLRGVDAGVCPREQGGN